MSAGSLFDAPLSVVNVGLERFLAPIRAHGADAVGVRWRPPERVPLPVSERRRLEALTDVPNRRALDRLLASRPFLVDVRPAREVIPELADGLILHAGPPLDWEEMIGPMRGAVIGALQFEGLAGDAETAEALAGSGSIRFAPNHHHAAVGPMAGITSASMPLWVVENRTFGNRAYANLNEGLGKVLRYGAFAAPVIERLRWTADVLGPSLAAARSVTVPWTSPRLRPTPCRWATRCITAIARPRRCSRAASPRLSPPRRRTRRRCARSSRSWPATTTST